MKHYRLSAIALLFGVLAACSNNSPEPDGVFFNTSFEYASPQGHPVGWYIEGEPASISVTVDGTYVRQGQSAMHVQVDSGEAYIYTPLWKDECLVRTDAKVNVHVTSPDIRVSMFYLVPGVAPRMGEASDPSRTGEWQAISVSRSTGEECAEEEFMLGIHVSGEGEAWIDAVELDVSPPITSLTDNPPRAYTANDLAEIREQAIAIPSPTAIPGDARRKIGRLFDDARLVGLGENSHGAAALFDLKQELVRMLVEDHGFGIFALEMPAGQAGVVNDYVLGRHDDDRKTLLALSYPAWQTEDMWAVIEWLREYNRDAKNPVTLLGLDTARDDERSDDQRMADKAISIMNSAGENARMIIWADNTHVTRSGNAMGAQLSETYGRKYTAVGFTFDTGHYSAYGSAKRYAAQQGYPGTHEHILAAAGLDTFLLDLRELPQHHALNDLRGFRYIGSQPQEFHQFYPHQLDRHFDVIGFVRQTDSSRYLLQHEF